MSGSGEYLQDAPVISIAIAITNKHCIDSRILVAYRYQKECFPEPYERNQRCQIIQSQRAGDELPYIKSGEQKGGRKDNQRDIDGEC